MREIFPDLRDRRRWMPKYRKWQRLRTKLNDLRTQARLTTDPAELDALEQQIAGVMAELAPLQQHNRYLWLHARPILDRWQVVAES